MINNKLLLLLGIGAVGALLLLARKGEAKPPENTIQVISCLTPENVVVGDDITTGAVLSTPMTNTTQVTKTMESKINNCVKTKEITMSPGENRTETITFTYTDCPLDVGNYNANINIL